jgi:hypothetical protein
LEAKLEEPHGRDGWRWGSRRVEIFTLELLELESESDSLPATEQCAPERQKYINFSGMIVVGFDRRTRSVLTTSVT